MEMRLNGSLQFLLSTSVLVRVSKKTILFAQTIAFFPEFELRVAHSGHRKFPSLRFSTGYYGP